MQLDPADRQNAISRLRAYLVKFDAIDAITVNKTSLKRDEKENAQKLFKALKESLAADCKMEQQDELTLAEQAFVYPAIRNASATIRVRWNSNPLNWHSELYSARLDISHMLDKLENPKEK